MTDEQLLPVFEARIEEERLKLALLFQHYSISAGDFRGLSLALARQFIRGFQEETPRGRKPKWKSLTLGALYVEIRRTIETHGFPHDAIATAAKVLAQQNHWLEFLDRTQAKNVANDPAEALRRAYYVAEKSPWSRFCWESYCCWQANANFAPLWGP